jgi:hypothetical protein
MVTAALREMLNALMFERRPPFIGRASITEYEGTLKRTQLRQHADFLQDDCFRNIASVTTALFLAICGDRQVIGTDSFAWKRTPRVLGCSLQPMRTHRAPTPRNEAFVEHLPEIVGCSKVQLSARRSKRRATATVAIFVLSLSCIHGAALTPIGSQMALASLQAKVDQAQPKDRCFLYAMLVNQMTKLAGEQFNSDDPGQASETLKLVQRYIENIRTGVTDDSRKVKDAELLMRRSSFQLTNLLRESSREDRVVLQTTLKELNQVQEQLMIQVFRK